MSARIFLIVSAIGLTPIALSYGADPAAILNYLFGFTVEQVNPTHIFRAVMGLYLALVLFWVVGAFNKALQIPALWSLIVFMFGLAAGRVLSLIVDGWPHWLLFAYLVLEIAFGMAGVMVLRNAQAARQ